jgi:hypothetical protein
VLPAIQVIFPEVIVKNVKVLVWNGVEDDWFRTGRNNKYLPLYFPFHHLHPLGHSQTPRLRSWTARGELVNMWIKLGILRNIWDNVKTLQW